MISFHCICVCDNVIVAHTCYLIFIYYSLSIFIFNTLTMLPIPWDVECYRRACSKLKYEWKFKIMFLCSTTNNILYIAIHIQKGAN